ncbi:MAG TPA: hypothetical protein VHC69_12745 [Polyangiaceae bacterium]|nr:hypothetical protein [Polyangiaceae bacterium]
MSAAAAFRDPVEWEATLPGVRPSSPAWRATIKAIYGTPLEPAELALFTKLSGGRPPPSGGTNEFLGVIGRRGGKSETISRVAVFEALHGNHAVALAPGQVGLIPVISPLREQSAEIIRYVKGLCELPAVKKRVARVLAESVEFKTGVTVAVMTADAVNVSGPTVVTAIRDEWAKWPGDESTMPDREIENSLRPALAPVEGAPRRRLIGITSSYIQEGLAFETDRDHFGRADSPVLVVRGATATYNPNIDRAWLAREKARIGDATFAREYLGEWQPAIVEGYFPATLVTACVDGGRVSSPPVAGVTYYAAIDAAFRGDLFALAVAHREQRPGAAPLTVVDGVWTWRAPRGEPLPVEETVAACASIIKPYGALTFADQFALDPLKEAFARYQVYLQEAPWTATTKPTRFSSVRADMTNGRVRLPDDSALVRELCNIRARLLRSGGEHIEARSGTDDRVHAAVLAASEAMTRQPDLREAAPVAGPPPRSREAAALAWEQRLQRQMESDAWRARFGGDDDYGIGPD